MKKILIFVFALLVLITMTLSFVSCKKNGNTGDDIETENGEENPNENTGGGNRDTTEGEDNTGSGSQEGTTGGDNTGNGNEDDTTGKENTGDEGEDAACTHESISGTTIKFSDYGSTCGGGIYWEECSECKEVFTSVNTLVTFCIY